MAGFSSIPRPEIRDSITGCCRCPVTGSHFCCSTQLPTKRRLDSRETGSWLPTRLTRLGLQQYIVQPFPSTGAKWQVSTGGGSDAQWRRDGRELFYVATDGTLMAAPISGGASAFEVGTPRALFQTRRPMTRGPLFFGNYAPAADGQRFPGQYHCRRCATQRDLGCVELDGSVADDQASVLFWLKPKPKARLRLTGYPSRCLKHGVDNLATIAKTNAPLVDGLAGVLPLFASSPRSARC